VGGLRADQLFQPGEGIGRLKRKLAFFCILWYSLFAEAIENTINI
jgi:hypothetical protein